VADEEAPVNEHEAVIKRAVTERSVVAMVGGLDTGKTTLSREMVGAALEAGRTPAYVDADLGQKAVGPPTTVGLKVIRSERDLEPAAHVVPDACYFVGAITPQGNLLPVVTGVARLLDLAREAGADFCVLDTSGLISGVYGQLLKYHKFELARPDLVIGLQRGGELEPLLGIVERFLPAEVLSLSVPPAVVPASVEQRAARREESMRGYFAEPLHRFRVKPTVFMPALPAFFDLAELDRVVVGLSDGEGNYVGIGYLEHTLEEGILRLISPVAEAPRALRLGSVRLEEGFRAKRVDLRNLFGAD
jgi:polynucleotide 5'-kinase involved in rRNA processing